MKLFKSIYFSVIGFLAVLLLVFSIVDVGGRSVRGNFDVDTAAKTLETLVGLSNAPHSVYDESEHDRVLRDIRKTLTDYGVKHNPDNSKYKIDYYNPATNTNPETGNDFDRPTSSSGTAYERADTDPAGNKAFKGVAEGAAYLKDASGKRLPTWYEQDAYLEYKDSYDPDRETDTDEDTVNIRWSLRLKNIIAVFPAENANTARTVVMQAHYDSVPMGQGASDDLSSVAAMLTVIKYMSENSGQFRLKNNIAFIFTDGEENGLYGASLARLFKGFEGALTKTGDDGANKNNVGFVANFESRGTSGTDVMFETADGNSRVVRQYAKINNSIYSNSLANFIYSVMPNGTDFSVWKDDGVPGLNFANIGGGDNYHTANDNLANATDASGLRFLSQHGDIMLRIAERFGDTDLSELTASQNSVFFTYLTFMTVYYPIVAAIVLGALIVGLLLFAILANVKLKSFSFAKMGLGAAAQGLAVVLGVGLMYGAYYLFALIAVLFGKADIHAVSKISASSPFLMICATALAALFSAIVINIFKRVFKIRANDVVAGSTLILGAVAAGLSFALPEVSFVLAWLALLEAVVFLCTTLFKGKFKNKFGFSVERLFLPFVPLILCIPVILPICVLAGDALGASMYPLIMALPLLTLGFVTPYFSYLKPALDKVFAKLPPVKFKQEVVRDTAADKNARKRAAAAAKAKGRAPDKPQREYRVVSRPMRYSNSTGFAFLAAVLFIALLIATNTGASFSRNISGKQGFSFGFYDDALVYVRTKDKEEGNYWMVKDLDAYLYMSEYLEDYEWNADKGAYVKYDAETYSSLSSRDPTWTRSSTTGSENTGYAHKYRVTPAFGTSGSSNIYSTAYTLTIDNTDKSIKSVVLKEVYGNAKEQEVLGLTNKETIVLTLRNHMDVTFRTDSQRFEKTVEYREYVNNSNIENNFLVNFWKHDVAQGRTVTEYKDLRDALTKRDIRVRGTIVFDWTIAITE
jgi:hypothetical protein